MWGNSKLDMADTPYIGLCFSSQHPWYGYQIKEFDQSNTISWVTFENEYGGSSKMAN